MSRRGCAQNCHERDRCAAGRSCKKNTVTKLQVLGDSVQFKASSLANCSMLNENVIDKNGAKLDLDDLVYGISK